MSIRWQLICAVAFVHATLMVIFVLGTVQQQRDFLASKAHEHVEFQARSLADSSQHMLLMNDCAAIDEVLANLSKDGQIKFALVTDPSGQVLSHTTNTLEGQILTDPNSIAVLHGPSQPTVFAYHDWLYAAAPIQSQGTLIGWAWVGRDFLDEQAYLHGVILTGLLYTTLAAAVGTVVAVFMASKLTLPLRLLLAGAKRLEDDRLEEPIPLTTENEVRTVTEAFNTAMKRLADQRNSLRKEVDDRIHAEQELHQIYGLSHRRAAELDAVIQSLPEAVLIGTAQGITKCNARAMSLLNATSLGDLTQPEGRNAIFSAADRQPLTRRQLPFDRALQGEISVMDVILQRRDTSEETFIRVAAAPVTQNGNIVGAVSVVTDITSERREQEQLRRAKGEAEEANRAKDHFLAVLSHELRTPLTPVLTLAQMLERDPELPSEAREDVITIRRNVELEARLIDDLLDLTRISRGKVELNFVSVNLHEKIKHVLRMCESEAVNKSLRVSAELKAERFIVSGDSTRLQQVLWNLLRNAIKFTRKGDSITVRTWNAATDNGLGETISDRLIVEVADTGIGIEPDGLSRVFEAFEQGGREVTRVFGGLGLGLTISKAMVDLHHGQLSAASAGKNQGATFTISLPLDRSAQLEVPAAEPIAPAAAARRSILLVEDHADTSKATARLLTQSGYAVQTAATVAQAIQVARTKHFDLIISDIGLPDGSGHDLIRKLVSEGPVQGEHVKGIAISGFGQPSDLAESEDAGFVGHLVKPVNPDVLLHAVDDALQKE